MRKRIASISVTHVTPDALTHSLILPASPFVSSRVGAAHGRAQPWQLHCESDRERQRGAWKEGLRGENADNATDAVNEGW